MTLLAGRYRLLSELGKGGMGTVWRAADELLRQEVAVKEVRFPPDLGEAERAELADRTLREARAAAALRGQPSIVTVHDVVLDDGRPWIVMELVRGRSLDRVVRQDGPLPPRRVAEIGLRMIEALSAAHASGILHRDVKPANVMLTDDGRVLLADFGIATIAGDVALTQTGLLSGSPGYIAPERLRGETDGPPADLWSLGATLFTAVEGSPPFARHNEAAVLAAVLMQEPAPFRLAGPLGPVLAAILDKDPVRRCSPAEATAQLTAVAQGGQGGQGGQGRGHAAGAPDGRMTGIQGHHAPGTQGHHAPGVQGDRATGPDRPPGPQNDRPTGLQSDRPTGPQGGRMGLPGDGREPATQGSRRPRRRRVNIIIGAALALVLTATAGIVIVPQLFPNFIRLIGYVLAPRSTFTPSPVINTTPKPTKTQTPLVGEFDACDLLTNAQVRSLFGRSMKRQWVAESSCRWSGDALESLSIMAIRGPSESLTSMVHKQTLKFMRDEPKRNPGTKTRNGPAVGEQAFSHTGESGFAWQGAKLYSTKVAFVVANVSVTVTVQNRKKGYGTADQAAKLIETALGKRRQD
ncbi:serine/threonine-protein kinase [Nonomuraea sp. NPDC050404]|uniref:serine/threonine-protein kinase n=1 Tax=Nonomuraea sp. NPDC050404 TaxID=3155783 RepID=UPI0033CBFCBD